MTSESNQNNSGFYYVYILQSTDYPNKFYTGFTENLQKRLADHNSGKNPHTAKNKPWRIKTAVAFIDRDRALEFERYFKNASGRPLLKSIFKS